MYIKIKNIYIYVICNIYKNIYVSILLFLNVVQLFLFKIYINQLLNEKKQHQANDNI